MKRYVSLEGNDQNPGTKRRPFRTVMRGMDQLRGKGKLYISAGTYREEVKKALRK